jgi:AcrR family transcriptional regulator
MQEQDVSLKDARRIELLNAAGELLATKPTASLAEIAEYAGIGKATLHRYFASREALILALGYRALEMVTQAISASQPEHGSAREALQRIIEGLVPLGDKLYFLLREPLLESHADFVAAESASQLPILALMQRGQANGEFKSDLSAEWILHYLNYALFATWQSIYDGHVARRDAARLLITTLLGGIATSAR